MPRIHITTSNGEVVESIDLSEYDTSKPIARAAVQLDVWDAVERALTIEANEA